MYIYILFFLCGHFCKVNGTVEREKTTHDLGIEPLVFFFFKYFFHVRHDVRTHDRGKNWNVIARAARCSGAEKDAECAARSVFDARDVLGR